ncbi:MAG: GGDEF domain-containing protein [Pseudomonadota bacterium]
MASDPRNGVIPHIPVERGKATLNPRSLANKATLVAGLAMIAPAIAGVLAATGNLGSSATSAIVVTATALMAAIAVVCVLKLILSPILALERALEYYRINGVHKIRPRQDASEERRDLVHLVDRLVSNVQAELRQSRTAADTDPLTGLLNRRGFDRYRDAGQTGSIVYIDLDHFKQVNDQLGHDTGDLVLSDVADLLRSGLREGELVARFGGEEFVVFLPGIDLSTAQHVAERIRISASRRLSTPVGHVTISAGVAALRPGEEFSSALARADRAALSAKRAGRNCVHVDNELDRTETSTPVELKEVAATAAE